mgnify:CR=1 FL=1
MKNNKISRSIISLVYLFRILRKINSLKHIGKYIKDFWRFRSLGGQVDLLNPILNDYEDTSGVASGHYFHQDLLVARLICEASPENHIDIGSRIDGFVAHVASFREINVLDIRPLNSDVHMNIKFVQGDATCLPSKMNSKYDSVSCLHSLEHFGLGRYSDTVDPAGHKKGFDSLCSLLSSEGLLYVSFPVSGDARVEFNAHRVLDPLQPIDWAKANGLELIRFDMVDDTGGLHLGVEVEAAIAQKYGCGIYTFKLSS